MAAAKGKTKAAAPHSGAGHGLPRGPHGIPPEEVAADQRRRLREAMVEVGGTAGYTATTVAHLIAKAGVSRKTFYALYDDRKQLLKEAFDDCWHEAFAEVKAASERTGGRTRRIEAFLRKLCRIANSRTGGLALCTYEIAAANPTGLEMREQMIDSYGELIQTCLSPDGEPLLSLDVANILAGATHREIDAHIRDGRSDELSELAVNLARWIRCHHPIPDGCLDVDEGSMLAKIDPNDLLAGGRAPGTLTMAPEGYYTHAGPKSAGFQAHAYRERILDAVAQLASEEGYDAVTAERIIEKADIPDRTFLSHFKSREEAFAAAVEVGHVKAQGVIERVRAGAPDWRTGMTAAIGAFLEFLATEPHFTKMAFLRAPIAGPEMMRRTNEHVAAYGRLIFGGAPQRRKPALIVPETVVQSMFELAFCKSAKDETTELMRWSRQTTYIGLVPFLGTAEAAQVAAG
jgi:AcrR family transcriptional regulator